MNCSKLISILPRSNKSQSPLGQKHSLEAQLVISPFAQLVMSPFSQQEYVGKNEIFLSNLSKQTLEMWMQ